MKVLVFADSSDGKVAKSALEAATYGKKIADQAGGSQISLCYGDLADRELDELASYGSGEIVHCGGESNMDPQRLAKLVESVVRDQGADLVIFSHDYTGKSVAPIAAARLKAGLVAGAVDYPSTDGGFSVKKAVFSGKAFANVKITSDVKVISLLPNSISKEKNGAAKNVANVSPDLGSASVNVIEFKSKGGEGINLTEAELVVSAGRGLKGPENWGMIDELAGELGAATACSRPVADIGWRPHHEHVGQTGIAIRPNLYIAVGISGAIQHLAGVNGSKVIVVINTDSEAPFFKAADYGVVGDAFEVVPKLLDAVKAHKASQA